MPALNPLDLLPSTKFLPPKTAPPIPSAVAPIARVIFFPVRIFAISSLVSLPPEIRMQFISALNTHPFIKPLCMTAMFAGLRAGELLALRWENIDFKDKTINVRNGITQVPIFDEKGKVLSRKTVIGDTKTACSVREVPIPDILVDALKDWKKEQWVKQQLTGVDLLAPNAIVFCNQDGTVRTYAGTRHIFDRFARRHGFF